jgi:hypothetical protein
LATAPSPDQYIKEAVKRLRSHGLTKPEVYTIINLGLGLPRPQPTADDDEDEPNGTAEEVEAEIETAEKATDDHDAVAQIIIPGPSAMSEIPADEEDVEMTSASRDNSALALVIESIEERFPEDVREDKVEEMLAILRQCISQADQRALAGEEKV